MWMSHASRITPGCVGVKSRDCPGAIDWLNANPGDTTCTLCVSPSSLVNRIVWPSAIACTRGTNCNPRWLTRTRSATRDWPAGSPSRADLARAGFPSRPAGDK